MMVSSAMREKISRHARTPASSLSNGILEAGFAVVVSDQTVLLNDQANVTLTGLREPMFQHQTVATGFHVSPLGSAAPAKSPLHMSSYAKRYIHSSGSTVFLA